MELVPGQDIGQYQLVEPAGTGGMAVVWRAYHSRLDRHVAIKFLSPQYASEPEYLRRFEREARAISRLDHPNILTVYDYGEVDGWTYMVSPFVGGGTLASVMNRGPWPLDQAFSVLEPLAAALDYAHAEGIVHRDVKPSNILFTDRGHPILADFGIARILEASTLLSHAGLVIGTPMYMSPEQADGQPSGPSSDLYSLGVVAYEMLTGRPPFTAETPLALLRAHIDKPLPPPRTLNPALPETVEAALFKVMAKDPSSRFRSGADFASDLHLANSALVDDLPRRTVGASVGVQASTNRTRPAVDQPQIASDGVAPLRQPRLPVPSRRQTLTLIGVVFSLSAAIVVGTLAAGYGDFLLHEIVGAPGPHGIQAPSSKMLEKETVEPFQLPDRCTDLALRFPGLDLSDPRGSVGAAYRANGVDIDLPRLGNAPLLTASQSQQVLGGWMAISLLMERSGELPPTLADWLASDTGRPTLADAIRDGWRVDGMITSGEWETMRGWPATSCEGAFLHDPRNVAPVHLMERVVARGVSSGPGRTDATETVEAASAPTITVMPAPRRQPEDTTPVPGQIVVVRGTGGSGARLRSQPGSAGAIITVIPEFTPLVIIGQDRVVEGLTWRNVRAPNGSEGWIAANLMTTD